MIKIRCISDGDKHFESAILEYIKRVRNYKLEVINYKSSKKDNPTQIITEDTEEMIKRLRNEKIKNPYVVLLSKDGHSLDTEQWKFMMTSKQNESIDIIFLIGGPYGFDEKKLEPFVDTALSFGKITMPHGLVKLVLLEQIYRCLQIMSGKQYHY